jgi:hypothetical protein
LQLLQIKGIILCAQKTIKPNKAFHLKPTDKILFLSMTGIYKVVLFSCYEVVFIAYRNFLFR